MALTQTEWGRYTVLKERLTILEGIEALFAKALKLESPWKITRVDFQEVYKETTRADFERALKKWYFWATHGHIEEILETARTIKSH
jgi:transposase